MGSFLSVFDALMASGLFTTQKISITARTRDRKLSVLLCLSDSFFIKSKAIPPIKSVCTIYEPAPAKITTKNICASNIL